VWIGPRDRIRDDQHKFIVDRRTGREEFCDLLLDPGEKDNCIFALTAEQKELTERWRALGDRYRECRETGFVTDKDSRRRIKDRLKMLGYIE
jgi:hypothetical protein